MVITADIHCQGLLVQPDGLRGLAGLEQGVSLLLQCHRCLDDDRRIAWRGGQGGRKGDIRKVSWAEEKIGSHVTPADNGHPATLSRFQSMVYRKQRYMRFKRCSCRPLASAANGHTHTSGDAMVACSRHNVQSPTAALAIHAAANRQEVLLPSVCPCNCSRGPQKYLDTGAAPVGLGAGVSRGGTSELVHGGERRWLCDVCVGLGIGGCSCGGN